MTTAPIVTEIVRLPVGAGGATALTEFLDGHPYFADAGLDAFRILVAEEGDEVALVLDWKHRDAGRAALATDAGVALLDGLRDLTTGAPEITYYRAA